MREIEIKLIEKDTDISSLNIHELPWDVVVGKEKKIPYQVVRIKDYYHSIGGRHGNNDLWMYPRGEKPTYENLVEYQGRDMGVCWGIKYEPYNYIRSKWDEAECFTTGGAMITRNGEDFYFCREGIDMAKVLINRISKHPIGFNCINWDKHVIGRKVWWRSEPAIITNFIKHGQACVILEPDGIDKFTTPAEFAEEEGDDYYCGGNVKTDIFDKHIWWFRD